MSWSLSLALPTKAFAVCLLDEVLLINNAAPNASRHLVTTNDISLAADTRLWACWHRRSQFTALDRRNYEAGGPYEVFTSEAAKFYS